MDSVGKCAPRVSADTVPPVSKVETLETDYLVVGAGAMGMAFTDAVIEDPDVDVVIVDRRHAPGGHWIDSYPFVQLHQPSRNYGVTSTPLGSDRIEHEGGDSGFYERATGPEICGYFDDVMRHRLLASGRVRFFPLHEYVGDSRFRSRLTGDTTEVAVRRSVVDATYMESRVPATHAPPFSVSADVRLVPAGGLVAIADPPAGFVVIGGGKTATDACGWLLDRDVDPDDITWIRPRDSWLLNREFFQPGECVVRTFEGVVTNLEAVAASGSVEETFDRLEDANLMLRTDRSVQPGIQRGATMNVAELADLRRIENVVRRGYVHHIDSGEITLDDGSIPTRPDHVHVHCASPGLGSNAPRPVFADDTITLQVITRVSLPLSAAIVGFLETTDRGTDEKNRLLTPNPWPATPFGWLRCLLTGLQTEMGWGDAPDLQRWVENSRLNLLSGLAAMGGDPELQKLQERFLTSIGSALETLDEFAAVATPEERSMIVDPEPPPAA